MDSGNGSVIWFSIETPNAPFVVDLDTGEVTTAGVFRGLSGTTIDVQVRAFDNFGIPPTEFTVDTLSVSTRPLSVSTTGVQRSLAPLGSRIVYIHEMYPLQQITMEYAARHAFTLL